MHKQERRFSNNTRFVSWLVEKLANGIVCLVDFLISLWSPELKVFPKINKEKEPATDSQGRYAQAGKKIQQ